MLNDDFQIKFYLYKQILMEREQHELYEYAEKIEAKKRVVSSFCASILASLFCLSPLNFLILD
jgi:hypothetical protein